MSICFGTKSNSTGGACVQQNLDEKKSKHATLVQEIGFGLALLHSVTEAGMGGAALSHSSTLGDHGMHFNIYPNLYISIDFGKLWQLKKKKKLIFKC
jgi:hypothetical protein